MGFPIDSLCGNRDDIDPTPRCSMTSFLAPCPCFPVFTIPQMDSRTPASLKTVPEEGLKRGPRVVTHFIVGLKGKCYSFIR